MIPDKDDSLIARAVDAVSLIGLSVILSFATTLFIAFSFLQGRGGIGRVIEALIMLIAFPFLFTIFSMVYYFIIRSSLRSESREKENISKISDTAVQREAAPEPFPKKFLLVYGEVFIGIVVVALLLIWFYRH
jgi:hypothetical protein